MNNKLFQNWQPIADALADVRNDNTSTDWMLAGFAGNRVETLEYVASGEGCVSELKNHLKDDQAMYGLVRISERIDESDTIKFCFIKWIGSNMKPLNRAKITALIGEIASKFKPYHVDLYCSELGELSQEIVEELVGKASMAKSAVIDNNQAKRIMDENERKRRAHEEKKTTPIVTTSTPTTPSAHSSSAGRVNQEQKEYLEKLEEYKNNRIITEEEFEQKKNQLMQSGSQNNSAASKPRKFSFTPLSAQESKPSPKTSVPSSGSRSDVLAAMERATLVRFPNADAIIDAFRQVRSDGNDVDWMLIGYTDLSQTKDMQIDLVGTGTGGVEELKHHLRDDGIFYGLVRMTDQIDNSITVKFVFIHFMGNNLKPMARARVTTHKLTVSDVFQPYHVETFASNADELSHELLQELVGSASFSKSNVIDNNRARAIMDENESKRKKSVYNN